MSATGSSATAAARPAPRIEWIDMARGLCVIGVVLVHVVLFHIQPLELSPEGRPVLKLWLFGNEQILAYVRMPLLLFVSGWLASSKIAQGLSAPRTRLSIATNVWLFVVWSAVYAVLDALLAPGPDKITSAADSVPTFLAELLYPGFGPLWFVYVLALSVFVLSLLRRVPMPVVLTGLVVIGWAVERLTQDQAGVPRAVFFALGVYFGPRLAREALKRSHVWLALGVAAVFGALLLVTPVALQYPVSLLACAPFAIVFLAVTKYTARWRRFREVTSWIGRRTLGVYVLHWVLVGLLVYTASRVPGAFAFVHANQFVPIVYALALTASIVAACLALEPALKAVGLRVLFVPPHWVDRLVRADGIARR